MVGLTGRSYALVCRSWFSLEHLVVSFSSSGPNLQIHYRVHKFLVISWQWFLPIKPANTHRVVCRWNSWIVRSPSLNDLPQLSQPGSVLPFCLLENNTQIKCFGSCHHSSWSGVRQWYCSTPVPDEEIALKGRFGFPEHHMAQKHCPATEECPIR